MSEPVETCEDCGKPYDGLHHTFVGFEDGLIPVIAHDRDPKIEPCPLFDAIKTIWDRMETAENELADLKSSPLADKTAALSEATTKIANLQLRNKQLQAANDTLTADRSVAVADACKAAVSETQTKLADALAQTDLLRKDWAAKESGLQEELVDRDLRLSEHEQTIAELRTKIEELNAQLVAELARANDAEARALADMKTRLSNLALAFKGPLDEMVRLCGDEALPSPEPIETLTAEPDPVVEPAPVAEPVAPTSLVTRKKFGRSARAVPPPAPAPTAPADDASTSTAPAPAAAAPTALVCMCCPKPAVKIAKDVLELKVGGYFSTILLCEDADSHAPAIHKMLGGMRADLVNPPADLNATLGMFTDIAPTPTI